MRVSNMIHQAFEERLFVYFSIICYGFSGTNPIADSLLTQGLLMGKQNPTRVEKTAQAKQKTNNTKLRLKHKTSQEQNSYNRKTSLFKQNKTGIC